jgi:hypothetical protein
MHIPSLLSGTAGVGSIELLDIATQPDTATTVLKVVVGIISLIPTIKSLVGKKKKTVKK